MSELLCSWRVDWGFPVLQLEVDRPLEYSAHAASHDIQVLIGALRRVRACLWEISDQSSLQKGLGLFAVLEWFKRHLSLHLKVHFRRGLVWKHSWQVLRGVRRGVGKMSKNIFFTFVVFEHGSVYERATLGISRLHYQLLIVLVGSKISLCWADGDGGVLREDPPCHFLVLPSYPLSFFLLWKEVQAVFSQNALLIDKVFRWYLYVCFSSARELPPASNELCLGEWRFALDWPSEIDWDGPKVRNSSAFGTYVVDSFLQSNILLENIVHLLLHLIVMMVELSFCKLLSFFFRLIVNLVIELWVRNVVFGSSHLQSVDVHLNIQQILNVKLLSRVFVVQGPKIIIVNAIGGVNRLYFEQMNASSVLWQLPFTYFSHTLLDCLDAR